MFCGPKQNFQRVLFPEGLVSDGESYRIARTCIAFQLLAGNFQSENQVWRPVRESNPCRRREREGTCGNSRELSGMNSTLPHLEDSTRTILAPISLEQSVFP